MDSVSARRLLRSCFDAGVAAVEPEAAVARSLEPIAGRVVLFAIGKAAPAMARGAARALRRDELEGLVISNHPGDIPDGLELILGSHPVPDERSIAAGSELLRMASSLGHDDTAVVLISGGGSALAEAPIDGLTLDDLVATTELLLRSGADISEMNAVRRRLSLLKGGGLAAAIAPARIITRAISDVVGDDPVTIASGPTVAGTDSAAAAVEVVTRLQIGNLLPVAVSEALEKTVAPAGPVSTQDFRIVAGGASAAHAAAAEAERLGVVASVVDTRMIGEASAAAGEALRRAGIGLSVFAGETTVTVTGDGVGGRNQEAGLVAATIIAGEPDVWLLTAGTDGIDGMTEAAGVIVDGETLERAAAIGLDAALALERNDSGNFFASLGEQLITGPTGTNVGDLWLVLRD